MKLPLVDDRSVLVTGCSSGIGAATARVLRERGWRVFPTARKPEDLAILRDDGFDAVALDLTQTDSVREAAQAALHKAGGCIGAVVNNAGFGQPGAVEDLTRIALQRQFEVNLFGLQELTNLLIPHFRQQGYGRIVNVSSVLGRVSSPMVGAYCASKFALEALSDALRVELRPAGIAVSLIEPGPIVSAFRRRIGEQITGELDTASSRYGALYEHEAARRKKQVKTVNMFTRPPEEVATKIAHALESRRPHRRYCVTIPAYLGAFAARFFPTVLVDRVLVSRLPGQEAQ